MSAKEERSPLEDSVIMLQKILAELKNDIATECERLGKTHDPARKAVLRERNERLEARLRVISNFDVKMKENVAHVEATLKEVVRIGERIREVLTIFRNIEDVITKMSFCAVSESSQRLLVGHCNQNNAQ
ncbi:uncharacterized protein LOC111258888 [Varroa jacobsoni]|uniref:uncharacterized protein LOC111258888 n=1 Tax=Varroa jacobsoni TaxID=62625 RepID=UPI000BF8C9E0|nr:uncharacterized protein LOC111258888 [Varroa jacobsoni]